MNIYEVSKAMTYKEPKKDIRVGDFIKQEHWPDDKIHWYKVIKVEEFLLHIEYPADPDLIGHQAGTTTYPKDLDWVVKRNFSDIRPKGPKLERRVSEEPEPELDEAVLREHIARHERMLRRFPSHPSDILILLNDI